MNKRPKILVVGSLAMDLIVSTPRFPGSGETVQGSDFHTAPGGKGANQAVQAVRLGADVSMVGKIGKDGFGYTVRTAVSDTGVDMTHVAVDEHCSTGIADIQLEVVPGEKSKNRILIVPGANHAITPDDIAFLKDTIEQYDMVMLQLEIPMQINELVARYAYDAHVPVMLNPAPSSALSPQFLECLTYLSPNEHEAADITGIPIRKDGNSVNMEDIRANIAALRKLGVNNALITLGSCGVAFGNDTEFYYQPCVDVVQVLDPTAAGDSFVSAFCTAVCAGVSHEQALEFANYTATLTVSRMGAQPSLPSLDEVNALMQSQNCSCLL